RIASPDAATRASPAAMSSSIPRSSRFGSWWNSTSVRLHAAGERDVHRVLERAVAPAGLRGHVPTGVLRVVHEDVRAGDRATWRWSPECARYFGSKSPI